MAVSATDLKESRILLYYWFTPIADPTAIMLWQKQLCESLGLTGRILISEHGINGTVGGSLHACKQYARRTREYPGFKGMEFKWSQGGAEDFPRLSVKVRDEIVAFGAPGELKVDENGVIGGGTHLKPEEVNKLVEERGDDVVFFDGRNAMEAEIGRFKNAVVPDVETTHDFIKELESGKYDWMKDKPVVSYCTGGIRCEVLSALMKNRGFEESTRSTAASSATARSTGIRAYGRARCTSSTSACTWSSPRMRSSGFCKNCGAATNAFTTARTLNAANRSCCARIARPTRAVTCGEC